MEYLKRIVLSGADLAMYIIPKHIPKINCLNPVDGGAPPIVGDDKSRRYSL